MAASSISERRINLTAQLAAVRHSEILRPANDIPTCSALRRLTLLVLEKYLVRQACILVDVLLANDVTTSETCI